MKNGAKSRLRWVAKMGPLVLLALLVLPSRSFNGSTSLADDNHEHTRASEPKTGSIQLIISLLWVGEHLRPENIEAIQGFRKAFGDISLVQFLNPAYLTKTGADIPATVQTIRSVLQPNDPVAMLLNSWRSFLGDSGVVFHDSPAFWGNSLSKGQCAIDCGDEVPLSSYNREDLDRIVKHGIDLLTHNGFPRPQGFIAGGWMASQDVLESVAKAGIFYDFSAVPPSVVEAPIKHSPLFRWLKNLWPKMTVLSQPGERYTSSGLVLEVGNNIGTMDFQTPQAVVDAFDAYANLLKQNPDKDLVFHIGFYQETANEQLPKLINALQQIFARASAEKIPLTAFKFQDRAAIRNAAATTEYHRPGY